MSKRSDVASPCGSCGEPVLAEDEFCEACGARLRHRPGERRGYTEIDRSWVAGVSDRGLVHRRNEDALFAETVGDRAAVVVCDGVSSSPQPHVAARVAADTAGAVLTDRLHAWMSGQNAADTEWDPAGVMRRAIDAAQHAVARVARASVTGVGAPACTVVAALWDGHRVTVGWVGDSRAYWLPEGDSVRLTVDHSWLEAQVATGSMPDEVAQLHPRAHAITRWLGADAPPDVPQVTSFLPEREGQLILCTDGLWNYAPSATAFADLVAAQWRGESAVELARSLTSAALAAGGHDNITVAVVAIEPQLAESVATTEEP